MIVKKKYYHNGIDFIMYQSQEETRGEATKDNTKYHLTGTPSLTQALNQYKYGDEVIIQVYNKIGSTIARERVADNYERFQVFFPKKIFIEMCRMFLADVDQEGGVNG